MSKDHEDREVSPAAGYADHAFFGVLVLSIIVLAAIFWGESASENAKSGGLLAVAHFFDPAYFQYNLIMVVLAILILPVLVFSYTRRMLNRKQLRLTLEIRDNFQDEDAYRKQLSLISDRFKTRASFCSYGGSLMLAITVVFLGASIILLMKPTPLESGVGIHFNLGSNILTMGPFIELFEKDYQGYYTRLIYSLTAFQFGFLGAYIYFIGSLARAYFTLDLTPHTFVDGSIRMIVASVLALVLSFGFGTGRQVAQATPATAKSAVESAASAASDVTGNSINDASAGLAAGLLPIISFFFGFYPKQALSYLGRTATRKLGINDKYRELPLSMLSRISYAHETRLEREGFDNIENLSHADAIDLAIRTGFGYKQLAQWIDEAWLAAHLREDYPEFVRRTCITSRDELRLFFSRCREKNEKAVDLLKMADMTTDARPGKPDDAGVPWEVKLAAMEMLAS